MSHSLIGRTNEGNVKGFVNLSENNATLLLTFCEGDFFPFSSVILHFLFLFLAKLYVIVCKLRETGRIYFRTEEKAACFTGPV